MEQRAPAEYILEVFADQTLVKDIVKGWIIDSFTLANYLVTKLHRCPSYHILSSLLPLHTTFSSRSATP